ncbi:hydrogenase formation protein HypD [Dehalococcoides sp. THU3]|uniref:hydrogenase formation protein HypD n=1 Tax=Dehalococcoides TaxID=61434 RepID=UPI00321867D7
MNFIEEFRSSQSGRTLLEYINKRSTKPARFMEFCGGHTVAIFRYGIRQLLPTHIEMLSGPGCPVCVTSTADLDKVIALSRLPGVIICSFGDLLRVPSSRQSLLEVRAEGADVRIVYSTMDALEIARQNPLKKVIFVGIGFETTAPTIAASVIQARNQGLANYYVISLHKITPPVMRAILDAGETRLSGIICPGHVSSITGSNAWEFIPREYRLACAVSGFESLDILYCVKSLVDQVEDATPRLDVSYSRAVKPEGNTAALKIMDEVFDICPANWRGIGILPQSGLCLRPEFAAFDAEKNFEIKLSEPSRETPGCLCGEIIKGTRTPLECKLFSKVCTPENPVGPCMVSSEGTCAAYYHYGGKLG